MAVASAPSKAMIRLNNISRTFRTQSGEAITALKDISMEIRENEFVTFIGPSGCGKSTLLKLVCGLLPPSRGEIRIHGEFIREPYSDIGFVFQQPALLPWRNVL